MMMIANLVGFVVGVDGIQFFLQQLFGTSEGMFAKIMNSRSKLNSDQLRTTVSFPRMRGPIH